MLLHLMAKLKKKLELKLTAVTVDEGVEGYRSRGIELAREEAKKVGVEHKVVSFKEEYGLSLDQIVERAKKRGLELHPCSYCGILRRRLINKVALEMEATKVAPENDPESSLVRILENRIWYRWGKEPPKRVHFEVKTEEEVREKMLYVLERSSSLALVEISTADVDRLRTAFNVARSLGREPILDERTAFLSHRLGRSGIKGLPQVGSYRVWRRRRGKGGIEVKYGVREPKAIKEFSELRDHTLNFSYPLKGEIPAIRTIAMISLRITSFIHTSPDQENWSVLHS